MREWLREMVEAAGEGIPMNLEEALDVAEAAGDNDYRLIGLLIERVEALQTATYYWDDRDLESVVDPSEVVAFDDVGDIVELRPIHELPRRWALATEDGVEWFDSREAAAEAAKEKP